jgi:hypothetical protein
MKAFFKRNLHWIFFTGWGLLSFIWLAIPYIKAGYTLDAGYFGEWAGYYGSRSSWTGVSGYRVMRLWEAGFGGAMSALFQIFVLLTGICLLGAGVVGFLKE